MDLSPTEKRLFHFSLAACLGIVVIFLATIWWLSFTRLTITNVGKGIVTDIQVKSLFVSKSIASLKPLESKTFFIRYDPEDGLHLSSFLCGTRICDHSKSSFERTSFGSVISIEIHCAECQSPH